MVLAIGERIIILFLLLRRLMSRQSFTLSRRCASATTLGPSSSGFWGRPAMLSLIGSQVAGPVAWADSLATASTEPPPAARNVNVIFGTHAAP